ncbi:hypothetical protein [Streptomyces sp. CNQ085]|uniref:hypothetical protein n=1 Tax=Streptomyces sp. CNQ085 TaxID=2886944 RepID=UPI001F50F5FD|nr:hypothetical protein [Streptomyces sp. CNQ085]MCI0383440.1 hypothetical protein [Streptomyces sp. CNQ085]
MRTTDGHTLTAGTRPGVERGWNPRTAGRFEEESRDPQGVPVTVVVTQDPYGYGRAR